MTEYKPILLRDLNNATVIDTACMLYSALTGLLNVSELNSDKIKNETQIEIRIAHKALRAMNVPFTLRDFAARIKANNPDSFVDDCWHYYCLARDAYIEGESSFEISGLNTTDSNPWTVF